MLSSLIQHLFSWRTACPLFAQKKSILPLFDQQIRTTYILKRRWTPHLSKKGRKSRILNSKFFMYDLVENTNSRKHEYIELILTQTIPDVGLQGDVLSVKPTYGRNKLLLPGLAVYATPENLEKLQKAKTEEKLTVFSSPTAQKIIHLLSTQVLAVVMNKFNPWTIEAWHILMSFRKAGFHVPDYALKMPSRPITGPDENQEGRDFYVTVTVNNLDTVNVRCRIHLWGNERIPGQWKLPSKPLFEEDAEILDSIPLYQGKTRKKKTAL